MRHRLATTTIALTACLGLVAACSSSDDGNSAADVSTTEAAPETPAPDTTTPVTAAPDTTAPATTDAPDETDDDDNESTTTTPPISCDGFDPPATGETVIFIEVDGRQREYALYVPESLDTDSPAPLVFNLHGRGSDRFQQSVYGGFLPLADRDGALLVHPQGITPEGQAAQQWNFAQLFDTSYSDEEFLLAVIEDVAEQVCVDRNRIYSTGMSSGGMMSSTLACLHGDVFAAVAPVAASIYQSDRCGGGPEVPFLTFHGTNDQVVAFGEPFDIAGVAASWAEHNGCELAADEEQIGDVTKREFDCDDDAETAIYVVDGGGHTWPGSPIEIGAPGDTTQDVSATELIWEFFARHTLDDN